MGIRIMIISCKNNDAWYADKIGKIYIVVDKEKDEFLVKTGNKKKPYGVVQISDCQILSR